MTSISTASESSMGAGATREKRDDVNPLAGPDRCGVEDSAKLPKILTNNSLGRRLGYYLWVQIGNGGGGFNKHPTGRAHVDDYEISLRDL